MGAPVGHLELRTRASGDHARSVSEHHGDLATVLTTEGLSCVASATALVADCSSGADAVRALSQVLPAVPALSHLTIRSAHAHGPELLPALSDLHRQCGHRGVRFFVEFLLDDDADALAALGRRPTSLGAVLEQSRALRIKGVRVRWLTPVIQPLVYRLEALFSLAADERIDPLLVPAFIADRADEPLDPDARRFVRDFVAYRLLGEDRQSLSSVRAASYQSLYDTLGSSSPQAPETREHVVVLEHREHGTWALRADNRPLFPALVDPSETGSPIPASPRRVVCAERTEILSVFAEGGRAVLEWAKTRAAQVGRSRPAGASSLRRVLIIGAYGGDHIGDAAILGGVLLRIHRRYGTRQAIVVSQRAEHTARLAAMLETPVSLTVEDYRQQTLAGVLRDVDGVVFGGGPLMDLPKQLVKHLYAIALARRDHKPFIVEGIGAGPFVRRLSSWTARRLVTMADRISVRTADDAYAPLVRGLGAEIGRDPAFDYLETRGADLNRLPQADRRWLERLLENTGGRVAIGINLRPLRPDYTTGGGSNPVAYTRFVDARFEERLADAMRQFHRAAKSAACFVFFPMNAIQFGSSDLRCAYRLRRLAGSDVDLRIWEGDPSIDGIVALLRRLDVAITMRFHAAIYALAQGRPVIGIDYRPGRRDKVAALLDGVGQSRNCARIDEITTDWIVRRLSEMTGIASAPSDSACGATGTEIAVPIIQLRR